MFTGIIKNVETVKSTVPKNQSLFVRVSLPKNWKLKKGQSISINGICSTVRIIGNNWFGVEYMPETISKTSVLNWQAGLPVNLEKSLTLADVIDGHLVCGHVDGVGKITDIRQKGDSKVFAIAVAKKLALYLAPKGSIALDGVSLTVVDVKYNSVTVSLVSYTLSHTNFGGKKVGDLVNVEVDLIAKYVYAILKK